jgi:hypothetical protein
MSEREKRVAGGARPRAPILSSLSEKRQIAAFRVKAHFRAA